MVIDMSWFKKKKPDFIQIDNTLIRISSIELATLEKNTVITYLKHQTHTWEFDDVDAAIEKFNWLVEAINGG